MKRIRAINLASWLGLVFVILTAACADNEPTAPVVTTTSPTPMMSPSPATVGQNVRVADITGNPNNYIGQTVTVVADLEEVRGPRAFKLDEDAPLAGGIDKDLWVLGPQTANLANIDDQWLNNKVRVTGVVRRFMVAEIEREIGWDLDPKIEVDLGRTQAVLIANSVERVR
jgi:hypothetical protein